jgi:hypothetical protein
MNMRLIRIFEGRLAINPPILLPNLSAKTVENAIHIPAIKNESTTLITKVLFIDFEK